MEPGFNVPIQLSSTALSVFQLGHLKKGYESHSADHLRTERKSILMMGDEEELTSLSIPECSGGSESGGG